MQQNTGKRLKLLHWIANAPDVAHAITATVVVVIVFMVNGKVNLVIVTIRLHYIVIGDEWVLMGW